MFVPVETILPLELLRSAWLISEDALNVYRPYVLGYLTGAMEAATISTGLFSKIALPEVPDNVALVVMNGALTKADICGAEGTRTLANKLAAAAANPKYEAILLYAENCPGGQVDGTKVMADTVKQARKKKPVVGAFSGMTCSGGVWIQSQCDEFYATSETDMVGCIGVMATMRNPKKLAENEDFITVISDLSPDKNVEMRDHQALKDHYLNPVAKLFHEDVKSGRSGKLKLDKENILSGATHIATTAKAQGLIDGIMPIHKIIARSLFLARTQKSKK